MKLLHILIPTLAAVLVLPSTSFAGKGKANKGAGKAQRPGVVVRSYDKDGNGQIEGGEVEALKKAFTADPKGSLAVLDKNSNGTLEDDEIAVVNARMSKHAERVAKKGKGKKKNAA
jgi:hypothetical protein